MSSGCARTPTRSGSSGSPREAADRVVWQIAHGRLAGRTEEDVAHEVRDRLVAEGHDHADFWIVGSGPNSASPHAEASDKVIRAGEPIVLDIGGTLAGYCSDTTRTLWVTGGDAGHGPDREFLNLHAVLRAAQAEASHAVRPGISCERVDAVAREIISAAGHGPHFFHRTGHGIGLEGHEDPYIVAGNGTLLEPGMAFSVEPGIYLEGRYGARIEDIVVCGEEGALVLNTVDRGSWSSTGSKPRRRYGQYCAALPITPYGQPIASMNQRTAFFWRATSGAIFSSDG